MSGTTSSDSITPRRVENSSIFNKFQRGVLKSNEVFQFMSFLTYFSNEKSILRDKQGESWPNLYNSFSSFQTLSTVLIFFKLASKTYFTFSQIHPEKKLGTASTHPTMSLDKTVVDFTPNTITGQCATCKNSHL